jgi:hypothetical protein
VLAFFSTIETVQGQDYGEYARGGVARRRNNRGPIVAVAAGGVFGGLLGWAATAHTMRRKYGAEKKELLQYIQLQNEVYKEREKQWQQEYQKLFNQFEQLERETVERDYEEFKAPDTNNDDMISKKEFEAYVTKYLSSFPELSEKDFPKFDDFDLDGDGQVSFEEWQEFLQMQKQQEAKKKESGKGTTKSQYADLINALYDSSTSANGFTGMQKNLAEKKRRQ